MIAATANWKSEAAKLAKKPIHLFEITGYGRKFATSDPGFGSWDPWIVEVAPVRQSADELGGTSALNDLVVTVLDKDRLITADFPFVFQGRECTLKTGFDGLLQADYALMHTFVVDRVESALKNTAWKFICKDKSRLVKKTIYKTGDDGQPIGKDHPKKIAGHPLDILKDIWQNQLSLPLGDLDTTTLSAYRDDVFTAVRFNFTLTKAPEAKAFIDKQLLAPLGGYSYTKADGTYSLRFFFPLPGGITAVYTFNPDNLATLPTPGEAELINVVTHRFDHDGDKFAVANVAIDADSETKFGQQGQHVIESLGMRSVLQGFSLGQLVAQGIFNRFADKNLKMSSLIGFADEGALLEIGDFVKVTHPLVPDRATGVLGITDQLFVVTQVNRQYKLGRIVINLADASQIEAGAGVVAGLGPFKIAPATVPEWNLANQSQRDTYLFVSDVNGKQSDGTTDGHPFA